METGTPTWGPLSKARDKYLKLTSFTVFLDEYISTVDTCEVRLFLTLTFF